MDYRKYLASTTASGDVLLADWRWLTGPKLRLWHVTKAGDALLRDPGDGSVHFLDTIAGEVERIAHDEAEFETSVASSENANKWLMTGVVDGQELLNMRPGVNECLSFKHPPALGGQVEPDNFETCDIHVHLSLAGQILRQIKDLPQGTPITGIKVKAPGAGSNRPWWKFW